MILVEHEPQADPPLTGNPHDPDQRGWLLGIGCQYTVHDIGQGRVVKIPNSLDGSRRFVGGWCPQVADYYTHEPQPVYAYHMEYTIPHILRLAGRYPRLHESLARPEASAGLCFTQDKVRPLVDLFTDANDAEAQDYLDASADICRLLWRHGIHEYARYFLLNNGVDSTGNVVCIDFGEALFDTTRVAERVDEAVWETAYRRLWALTPSQKAYYFETMKSRLSGQNFGIHWAADLDELDRAIIKRPLLAERSEEIPSLVERILERANAEEGWMVEGISPPVLDLFQRYTWYGSGGATPESLGEHPSTRWTGGGAELQNVLYRAAEACETGFIDLEHLPPYLRDR